MMAAEFRVLKPLEFHRQLFKKATRVDGRDMLSARPIHFETNAIKTADSSSLVKLGNTSVICGCNVQLLSLKTLLERKAEMNRTLIQQTTKPTKILRPETIEADQILEELELVNIRVVLPPICSNPSGFNSHNNMNRPSTTTAYTIPSKQSEAAVLLTRLLNRILKDSKCISNDQLRLGQTNFYWSLDIEVICLNYDGCLIDCALVAALTSISSLKLPKVKLQVSNEDDGIDDIPHIINEKNSFKPTSQDEPMDTSDSNTKIIESSLHSINLPISTSFAIIEDYIICDPSMEEENLASSVFSIAIDYKTEQICLIDKVGGWPIEENQLNDLVRRSIKRAKNIGDMITR